MAEVHIRQRFGTSLQDTFDAVSRHSMLARHLPLSIKVVKKCSKNKDGLGSVRAMGLPLFRPLKEQVVVFEPPSLLEYEIVGIMRHAIHDHHGILEFTEEGGGTLVDWHIRMTAKPKFMSKLILASVAQGIRRALAAEARRLQK